MEFDFLNVGGGKESGGFADEESRGSHDDAAFSVSSALQRPLLDNASPLQKTMPLKTLQEQKPKNIFFNPFPTTEFCHVSTVEAIESNQKPHIIQASQNQDMSIYSASTPHVNDVRFSSVLHPSVHGSSTGHDLTGATVSHQSLGSDILKSASLAASAVAGIFPRKPFKPTATSAQLTIFYAGSVNVYDDVPCDKAQNVLLMASEGCKAAADALDSGTEAVASMAEVTAAIFLPIAVPQARKASLARFLERRKERASSSMPYSCDKKGVRKLGAFDGIEVML